MDLPFLLSFPPRHHGAVSGVHVPRDAVQRARHPAAVVRGPAATQQLVAVDGVQPGDGDVRGRMAENQSTMDN